MNCGPAYGHAQSALSKGLISEEDITRSVTRSMTARFELGLFEKPGTVPFANTSMAVVNSAPHRALARRMAQEGLVLLKNRGRTLPLTAAQLRTVAVIGPNADSDWALLGNYHGCVNSPGDFHIDPNCTLTNMLAGVRGAAGAVLYAKGCDINSNDTSDFANATQAAVAADAVVLVLGLRTCTPPGVDPAACVESEGHDRTHLQLPGMQQQLLEAVANAAKAANASKPVVLVLLNGGAVSVGWAADPSSSVDAILEAWYPGQEGGLALADVLVGRVSPAGRLPISVYTNVSQLPPDTDMAMTGAPYGRTYRYFNATPLFNFGFGMSYAGLTYSAASVQPAQLPASAAGSASFVVAAELAVDTQSRASDEVTMVYARYTGAGGGAASYPLQQLVGFQRTPAASLGPGSRRSVAVTVPAAALQLIGPDGIMRVNKGRYLLWIGGRAPGSPGVGPDPTAFGTPQPPLQVAIDIV